MIKTILKQRMNKYIKQNYYPVTNTYFQQCSADGFALFGFAQHHTGFNHKYCLKMIREKNYSLNSKHKIRDIQVSRQNKYVYTMWACSEFLNAINKPLILNKLIRDLDNIGTYNNGMHRYCSEEIYYIVPNATSSAALMYAMVNQLDKTNRLLKVLKDEQLDTGNWGYRNYPSYEYVRDASNNIREEDAYHLAMIIYQCREINRLTNIPVHHIIQPACKQLIRMNAKKIASGSVGWGYAMIYLALKRIDNGTSDKALQHVIYQGVITSNFRVRSQALWALCKAKYF